MPKERTRKAIKELITRPCLSPKIEGTKWIIQCLYLKENRECSGVTFSKRDRRFFGIDRVENSFIANLRFRDQGDLRAEVGDPGGHGERLGLN